MTRPAPFTTRHTERGNVFAMLFGAVALTGVLAAVSMQTLTGPVTTITRVTQRNVAENNLLMNGKILINAAVAGVSGGDADADGIIEPAPFVTPGGGEVAPTNGGFLPTDLGLALTDPWGTKYGYCVWDHGTTNSSANRITGDDTASASTQPVIAIIAAGPDKTFQTNCPVWSGGPVTVSKAAGSDDLIEHYTYAEATASSNGLWTLNASDQAKAELRDSGGTARVTIDRSTGIGDFLGITTDTLAARSSVLTLDGGLRLDTDSNVTACAAGDAGVIRFNTTSGKLEVCNGTAWKAAGSDLWLENGTHIYSGNTGNVGIGTTTPTQKLDVAGNAAVSGNSTIGGTLGVTGATTLGDTLSVTGAATLSSTLAVTSAATLSSTLDVTGNTTIDSGTLFVDAATNRVGVGTATPAVPVHVVGPTPTGNAHPFRTGMLIDGDLGTIGGRLALRQFEDNPGERPTLLAYRARGSIASPAAVQAGDVLASIVALPFNGTDWNVWSVGMNFFATENTSSSATGGAIAFSTTANGTTNALERLRIDQNGNIGIGTMTPQSRLHVAGGIQLGDDTATCPGASNVKLGTLRFNAGALQLCVSGGWSNVGADTLSGLSCATNEIPKWNGSAWACALAAGDNLGNHVATTNLAMGAYAITSSAGTVIDANGGWHRTYGNTGWYNGTHGGGWYMTDTTYIRNYNSKQILLSSNITAPAFLYSSDRRLKRDIAPIGEALAKVEAINGITFTYANDDTRRPHLGVIAQDVEAVLPQAVADGENGFKSVDYPALVPVLIEAVKELKADNDNLRAEVEALKRGAAGNR